VAENALKNAGLENAEKQITCVVNVVNFSRQHYYEDKIYVCGYWL